MFNYNHKNNIIVKLKQRLEMSTYDLVKSYVDLLFSLEITMSRKTTLNAGKINRKLSRMLLDLPIHENDNLDLVKYTDSSNRYLTHNFYDIYERYIRLNIYELTGVSYQEFMNMSMIELEVFLKYSILKTNILDIEPVELTEETDNSPLFT